MGKVKHVIMGDEKAEEKAREKARAKREGKKQREKVETSPDEAKSPIGGTEAKREQKKLSKSSKVSKTIKEEEPKESVKADLTKSQDILKMLQEEEKNKVVSPPAGVEQLAERKKVKKEKQQLPVSPTLEHGKKYQQSANLLEKNKLYTLSQAVELAQKTSYAKFGGSVEVHFNVIDKGLRGTVSLPHGTGKQVRVVIATDELISSISLGNSITFDVLVAHPSMMAKLAKVAKILGPKGLMPNPKTGTIGENPEELAKKLSAGQFNWKTESDFPIIHTIVGKVSFTPKQLEENLQALIKSVGKDKIKSIFVKATMGPGIKVQI